MSKKRNPEVVILEYLEQQNRPYSAVDVFNNLHKEFGKTAVIKVLDELAAQGKITEKLYGKQKVYAPSQDKYGDYNEKELLVYDEQIAELQGKLEKLQQHYKKQEDDINSFSAQLTTEDVIKRISILKEENIKLAERISKLKSGTVLISKQEKDEIYKRKEANVQQWKRRKRMATDMLNCILEGYPKSKKELLEETGVETDEDVGVCLPCG